MKIKLLFLLVFISKIFFIYFPCIVYPQDITASLFEAVVNNDIAAIKLLLRQGADVNAADTNGWTALMQAASNKNVTMLKILLSHGAKINLKDKKGKTALMYTSPNESIILRT